MNIKTISIENIKNILLGFKTQLLSIMDQKIEENRPDTTTLMDKASYVSTGDPTSVNKADSAKKLEGIDSAPLFSIYGIDPDGNKGFYSFPVTSNSGGNFTKTILDATANVEQHIALADERRYYDLICQAYKFIPGEADTLKILKTFDNTEGYNFIYDDVNVTFTDGMQINKVHPLVVTTNSDGFFESEVINKTDYLVLTGII